MRHALTSFPAFHWLVIFALDLAGDNSGESR